MQVFSPESKKSDIGQELLIWTKITDQVFHNIGLAFSFNPRLPALLAEASRLARLFHSRLFLIHVGPPNDLERENILQLTEKLSSGIEISLVWEDGMPGPKILEICSRNSIDLLVAGALQRENLVQYYLGTIARNILRKSKCSVLLLLDPSTEPKSFQNVVVNAEDSPWVHDAIRAGCLLAQQESAQWLHIVREIKLYGLTMSAAEQSSEVEYENLRSNLVQDEVEAVQKILQKIPHEGVKVNIKMLSGKSGFELAKFASKKHADLLIVGAPPRRLSILDRLFPHDLEYIFANLPCNLLIINPRPHA